MDRQWFQAEVALFYTRNEDDILFQSTGGVSSNEGFFANVGTTRRLGLETGVQGRLPMAGHLLGWSLNYAYLDATYRDAFEASSPNHPMADADAGNVESGDRLPGIPRHSAKAALDLELYRQLRFGVEAIYYSDRHLRGDEANLDAPIDGYFLLNLLAEYRPLPALQFFARVNNVLDRDYETFGLYGEPDEVLEDELVDAGLEPDDVSPRFLSPGAPINGFVGIRVTF